MTKLETRALGTTRGASAIGFLQPAPRRHSAVGTAAGASVVAILLGIAGCSAAGGSDASEEIMPDEVNTESDPLVGTTGIRVLGTGRYLEQLRRFCGRGQDAGHDGNDGAGGRDDARGDGVLPDGGAFAPCPVDGTDCAIMPLGDSITDGFTVPGGYRIELFGQTIKSSKLITFVGRNMNGPTTVTAAGQTKNFPRNHEGYPGFTIDDSPASQGISPLIDSALMMFKPHIILLMIGTNDVRGNVDLANAPSRLGNLLDRITTDSPNALVVVAKITPTTTDTTNTRIQTYNNAIPDLVEARVAGGKHILMVDMYGAFTANASYKTAMMNGDVHPNPAGYLVMAETWYSAIQSYLP